MRQAVTTLTILLVLALSACQKNGQTSPGSNTSQTSARLSPEELGELGAKITKSPKHAEEMLSGAGLTESSFETAIRKVAADPEASKRYAAAFKKAKG
ncbi:MAG TPA: hypothetical protein VHL58_06790 [Thermoanaerobaculia bacterium]|nr:hypothetical protein [Thermoanaerobaculia bacterium]